MPSSPDETDLPDTDLPDYAIPNGFWTPPGRLPSEPDGHTSEMVCLRVGYALSVWGSVEEALATLFYSLATESSTRSELDPLMLTFGSIESLGARLEVTRVIGTAYFEKHKVVLRNRKPLNNLLEQIRRGAMIRNDIAHGIVTHAIIRKVTGPAKSDQVFEGSLLCAPFYMTGRNDHYRESDNSDFRFSSSKNIYSLSDIDKFAKRFAQLSSQIREYYCYLLSVAGKGIID